jgi:hypothetical protein
MGEFQKVNSITFFQKLTEQFMDKRFGNPWQPVSTKFWKPQR